MSPHKHGKSSFEADKIPPSALPTQVPPTFEKKKKRGRPPGKSNDQKRKLTVSPACFPRTPGRPKKSKVLSNLVKNRNQIRPMYPSPSPNPQLNKTPTRVFDSETHASESKNSIGRGTPQSQINMKDGTIMIEVQQSSETLENKRKRQAESIRCV